MKDVSRVVSSAEAVQVSSAKAGRRGPHRLLTNCCLTPSSFPFHYLSNSTFFSRNRNAISFHLWDKGDLLNCFAFSSKHKAVSRSQTSVSLFELFWLLIPVCGQSWRAGEAKEGKPLEPDRLFQRLLPWFFVVGTNCRPVAERLSCCLLKISGKARGERDRQTQRGSSASSFFPFF